MLLIDTTFAPGSQVLKKVADLAPELPAMVFISMSKSISRGMTTAGTVIANHTAPMIALRHRIAAIAACLDTAAKPDQVQRLVENHGSQPFHTTQGGVEGRCAEAYKVAVALGNSLVGNAALAASNQPLRRKHATKARPETRSFVKKKPVS